MAEKSSKSGCHFFRWIPDSGRLSPSSPRQVRQVKVIPLSTALGTADLQLALVLASVPSKNSRTSTTSAKMRFASCRFCSSTAPRHSILVLPLVSGNPAHLGTWWQTSHHVRDGQPSTVPSAGPETSLSCLVGKVVPVEQRATPSVSRKRCS